MRKAWLLGHDIKAETKQNEEMRLHTQLQQRLDELKKEFEKGQGDSKNCNSGKHICTKRYFALGVLFKFYLSCWRKKLLKLAKKIQRSSRLRINLEGKI